MTVDPAQHVGAQAALLLIRGVGHLLSAEDPEFSWTIRPDSLWSQTQQPRPIVALVEATVGGGAAGSGAPIGNKKRNQSLRDLNIRQRAIEQAAEMLDLLRDRSSNHAVYSSGATRPCSKFCGGHCNRSEIAFF